MSTPSETDFMQDACGDRQVGMPTVEVQLAQVRFLLQRLALKVEAGCPGAKDAASDALAFLGKPCADDLVSPQFSSEIESRLRVMVDRIERSVQPGTCPPARFSGLSVSLAAIRERLRKQAHLSSFSEPIS